MALEILLETALVPPITRLSEIPIDLCHFKAQMKTSDEPKFQSIWLFNSTKIRAYIKTFVAYWR